MWWGLAAVQSVLAQRPTLVAGALPLVLHQLAILARWSLSFYLLHQPVLIGALLAWVHLTR